MSVLDGEGCKVCGTTSDCPNCGSRHHLACADDLVISIDIPAPGMKDGDAVRDYLRVYPVPEAVSNLECEVFHVWTTFTPDPGYDVCSECGRTSHRFASPIGQDQSLSEDSE